LAIEPNKHPIPILHVWVICLALGLIWYVSQIVFRSAPSWDNMEELVWASSFEWGYQKHPPLPTWVLYPLTIVLGKAIWLTYALGYLSVVFTQIIIYLLLKQVVEQARHQVPINAPFLAILCTSTIAYYTVRGGDYNHNSMQLWSIAAMFLFYYQAWLVERVNKFSISWSYWALLGLFAGLAFLTKYSVLVQIAVLGLHFLWAGRWQSKYAWGGVLVALVVMLLTISPHLLWVLGQTKLQQGPLFYVSHSMAHTGKYTDLIKELLMGFLATQFYRIAPVILAICLILYVSKKSLRRRESNTSIAEQPTWWNSLRPDDRAFLVILTLGPTIISLAIGLSLSQQIEAKWAVTFYLPIGCLLWIWMRSPIDLQSIIKKIVVFHFLVALIYGVVVGPLASQVGRQSRANYPCQEVARQLYQRWIENPEVTKGQPLKFIGGDGWIAGCLISNDPVSQGLHMKVWIDLDDKQSPWISASDKDQAILLITGESGRLVWQGENVEKIMKLIKTSKYHGEESVAWTTKEGASPVKIHWAILPSGRLE